MAFSSNFFLFAFMPAVFAAYYASPHRHRNLVLLTASVAFYAFDSGWLAWVLLLSIALNHAVAKAMVATQGCVRRLWFISAIAVNLVFLFHYKYTGFLWSVVRAPLEVLGIGIGAAPHIEMPLGISFFTFQAISYLADIYLGHTTPARRLVDFGAYHSLFPQLIAGPIVRYAEVESYLYNRRCSLDQASRGICRFCAGLGKKLVLADTMGGVADAVFALPQNELTASVAWLGLLCYTLQIYFDFSGYSDMAIGLGNLLGFEFPENFNLPYRAHSITEFWHRWHMTLSRWFRDYLYIPLGGNKNGPWRTYRNLFVVFFLCGLWHGANVTFIIWGGYHGALLIAERIYRNRVGELPRGPIAWATTFVLIMWSWVFFRSDNLGQALHYFQALLGFAQPSFVYYGLTYFLTTQKLVFLVLGLVFAIGPFEKFSWQVERDGMVAIIARAFASLSVALYSAMVLSANSFNPFIYFKF